MNKRERFLAFANFQPVDRVPCNAHYVESLTERMKQHLGGKNPYDHFDMDTGHGAGLLPPEGFKHPDYSGFHPGKVHGKDGFSIDANGCGHQEHGFYHFTEYISPLRDATTIDEITRYPITSNEGWLDSTMRLAREEAHQRGTFASCWIGHMYENAWQVRGYEPFLLDLLDQREWAECLLDKFCANNRRAAIAAASAGYDLITIGDDVANQNALMFQPDLWREVMKPRWAGVIAAARSIKPGIHVWYHSDGNIWEILDDIVEIGINILNPVQPECMDPVAIRKRFGKRLAFDGCVGTQTTLPFGNTTEVRRVVRHLIDALEGKKGGLMLSPTHVLEPEVPPENIVAFFDECRK